MVPMTALELSAQHLSLRGKARIIWLPGGVGEVVVTFVAFVAAVVEASEVVLLLFVVPVVL